MLLIRKSTLTLKVKVHYINDQFTLYKISVNARAGCGPKSVAHQYIYGTLLFKHHEAFPFIINFGLLFHFPLGTLLFCNFFSQGKAGRVKLKVIIEKSHGRILLWNRNWDCGWIWADWQYWKKGSGPIMSNFWGCFFHVFRGKKKFNLS